MAEVSRSLRTRINQANPGPGAARPRHPEVRVRLVGEDGNAYAMLGRCQGAARRAGLPKAEIDAFLAEATAGNYDHLLATCVRWFDCQ